MLARERIELVSICSPASSHAPILADVLESEEVVGVLLEKPVGRDSADAEAILRMVERSKTTVAVNYVRRYVPAYVEAAAWINSGSIGDIQLVRGLYTKGVVNNGSHMLDLLRYFVREPRGMEVFDHVRGDGADPTLSFRAFFRNDVEACVLGVNQRAFNIFEFDILGTHGRIVFTDLGHLRATYRRQDSAATYGFHQLSPEPEIVATNLADGTRLAIDDLIESAEAGKAPQCTVQDGVAALSLSLELVRLGAMREGSSGKTT